MDLDRVGHYRVLRRLGSGGMGEVYEAEDTKLGRHTALKFLSGSLSSDPQALERFQREARAASSLNHPNICVIYEIDEHEGRPFIAMELLQGSTLRQKIAGTVLPLDEVLELGIQICDGLDAAHSKGIIHPDLKPENLFVTGRQQAKILDFGLAKLAFDAPVGPDSPTVAPSQLSTPGSTLGTLAYMSPEQVLGKALDVRTDLYSFGAVLYEMLTGTMLVQSQVTGAIFDDILHKPSASILSSNPKLPKDLDRLLSKALEKDRELRYQSAAELRSDLKRLKRDLSSRASSGNTAARPSHKRPLTAIAVLPFENANADPSYEYLSDGLTETIIDELSQIPKLSVVARSTVFRYKNRELDPQAVGKELNVGAVITGRLVRRAEMLTVAVEMVDTANGLRIWGERYNRRAEDLLAIEDDIGRHITERLRSSLTEKTTSRARRRPKTRNTAAYEAYLKGRYYWNKRSETELRKGAEYFEQAIALDPGYALAYAGLADFYIVLGWYSYVRPQDSYPRAKAAALKALEIDPNLAEPHTAMGFISLLYDWDMETAENHFRRALELNPKYAPGHHWYSDFLAANLRLEEAGNQARCALELDPLSLIINWNMGWMLYFSRQYEPAVAQFKSTLELDPNYLVTYLFLGQAYVQQGLYDEAQSAFQRAADLSQRAGVSLALLGHCQAIAKHSEDASKVLAELQARARNSYVSPAFFAWIHLGLGSNDQALTWLEKAVEERSNWLVWLVADPKFDPLRSEERFRKIVDRVGLKRTEVRQN